MKKIMFMCLMTLFSCFTKKDKTTPKIPIYDISLKSSDGKQIDLGLYKGKKILFVNVASKCGFTKQYEELQVLYEKYKDKLMIIGLPCNQFGSQEKGTNKEIQSFCRVNFGVTFLITEKINVKGENQHPIYQWLTQKKLNGVENTSVKWNFQKYLVNEKGSLIDYFYSTTKPLSLKITKHLN